MWFSSLFDRTGVFLLGLGPWRFVLARLTVFNSFNLQTGFGLGCASDQGIVGFVYH